MHSASIIMEKDNKVYIAGVLTVAEKNMRLIFEKIAEICEECGVCPHVPHLSTDPINHPAVTPLDVWNKNYHEVTTARRVIAYVGQPSLGTGEELEMARVAGVDIIAWWFRGEKVSRMVLGNPGVVEKIEAGDEEELYSRLKLFLESN